MKLVINDLFGIQLHLTIKLKDQMSLFLLNKNTVTYITYCSFKDIEFFSFSDIIVIIFF